MKTETRTGAESKLRTMTLGGLLLASLFLPICASAALGGDLSSVAADQQWMKAMRAVHPNPNYTVHEITTPYGTTVREYVSPDGKVFGVAWRGPFLPNLQQILGSYYPQFEQGAQAARAEQPRRSRNAPLTLKQPELVLHSGGHMRAYAGHAYVPGMVPSGVGTQEIR